MPRAWLALFLSLLALPAAAEEVGSVGYRFKWLGPNDKIVVEAFDDPDVAGVTCYVSHARTGGIKGAIGLAGRRLRPGWGLQVLRYGPGDYAGPHNDHHPENPAARAGYIDLHLSLCTPGVAHQWLVYSRAGHFSEIVSVAGPATVTAYRLPFWHYTTPLA
ncbi:MAG: hypothetical protein E6G95_08535, partial [Alphaproteobacteria bacterium]